MSFVAASSLGKCPLFRMLLRTPLCRLSIAFVVYTIRTHGRGESEERNDPVPVALPALDHGRETPSPLAAFECAQRLFGRRGIVGLVDRLQSLNQGLAVLPGRQADRIPDQVHDAGLHDRVREHGGDRVGKSLQPINDGEQNILHSAGLEVVHHAQPELGAFGLLDPQAEDVLVPGTRPHADGHRYTALLRTQGPSSLWIEPEGAKFWLRVRNDSSGRACHARTSSMTESVTTETRSGEIAMP